MITRRTLARSLSFAAAISAAGSLRSDDSEPDVSILEFNDAGEKTGLVRVKKVRHTEAEWRSLLTLKQFYVTRKDADDQAFYGTYFSLHEAGLFRCICCGTAVFSSDAKFDTNTGFPCFSAPLAEENIRAFVDPGDPQKRMDVLCRRCDAHLGHLYDDGPAPSGKRFCMNQSALKFVPRPKSSS